MCEVFLDHFEHAFGVQDSVPLLIACMIVLVSFTVQKSFIRLTQYLRLASLSSRENVIMLSVLGVNLFNYGFLYWMATWSFITRELPATNIN